MFHIGGLGWALVGLANGAHSVIMRDLVPADVLDALERRAITNVFLVPTVLRMLVELPGAADRDYSALRSIAYGSSPITPALLRRALATFGRPFFQVYGLTETHGAITQLNAEDHDPGGPREHLLRTAGQPYPWVELRTIRPADGQPTAPGEPGEICVRSAQVTPGYHGRPEETAAAIDADGWFHTGDIGTLDEGGYITITDRLKDLIITGGENVSALEVETVIGEHPAVEQTAVIGLPDKRWGEVVTAVVVPRAGAGLDPADVLSYARARLAGYKAPKDIRIVAAMPLGATGKVLKRALRESLAGSR
jgi:acyl-CoA synthetase (AMP-forming)/AMP-acid ligase II